MRILVDGDACPVKSEIITVSHMYNLEILLFYSTSHYGNITKNQSMQKIMVDSESQAVDMAIINKVVCGDIVVTGDFGLASLALGKNAYAISFNGRIFDDNNIDQLLFERHIASIIRKSGGRTKGPSKRKKEDNVEFINSFKRLIEKNLKDI